ncbi:MAG: hypothetical protein CL912_21765 [Deltaproteobacteria bacterium]|nr:hypothetical protein [Deltaproteobacteria bacterium]
MGVRMDNNRSLVHSAIYLHSHPIQIISRPVVGIPGPQIGSGNAVVRVLLRCDQNRRLHGGNQEDARELRCVTLAAQARHTGTDLVIQGPIVRISPYELHVNDPDFYEELYAGGGRKRNKYAWFVRLFGMTDGSLATIDHDHHRLRRSAISPFFSKTNVRKLEPVIQGNVDKLMRRLERLEGTRKPVNLNVVFGAFTSDIIIEYAFGESQGYLDEEDFNVDFFQVSSFLNQNPDERRKTNPQKSLGLCPHAIKTR